MPPVARTIGLGREDDRLPGRPPVAERAARSRRPARDQPGDRALHVDRRCRARRPGPGASGSSRGRSGRRRGRGAGASDRRTAAGGSARRVVRSKTAPHSSSSRTRSGASSAWSWAIRGLLRSLPPTIVSRKWTCHESAAATWPSAAATPPSAMTVWALPSSDLQTSPTSAPGRLGLDRGPQAGPAGADDEDVVRADLRPRSASRGPSIAG